MDLYTILGVSQKATPEEIKKSFRKLSLETHPDRPTGDEAKFKVINEAYEVLSDPQSRKQYDNQSSPEELLMDMLFRHCPVNLSGAASPHIFFEPMQFQEQPQDLIIPVQISLEQAYNGCSVPVQIARNVSGRGGETEVFYVNLPQGVDHNEFVVLENKGHVGRGGAKGNVQIVVNVLSPPHMQRKGLDLHYTCSITLLEALCGFTAEIVLFGGKKIKLSNVEGDNIIHPKSQKIVPQKGFVRHGKQGALVIEFDVGFPSALTAEKKKALREALTP
jgi:DnaJ-class molecular chaperone